MVWHMTREETIEQVAILFPYLTPDERLDWWKRLGCNLTELTVHMESASDKLNRLLAEKAEDDR